MLHCIQNRTFHLLNDVNLFNRLKGGLFLSKNTCTENSSKRIFPACLLYCPPKANLSSTQQRPGEGGEGIILWIFNTTSF